MTPRSSAVAQAPRGLRQGAFRATALTVSLALAACSGATAKSGGQSEPIVLRLIVAEQADSFYRSAIESFAATAHEASEGGLVIDIDWPNVNLDDSETRVIDEVRSGDADLANAPARAFDLVGIRHLVALQDPLTIDSIAAADAVAASPAVQAMLDGLEVDGLIGLGLYVENLRRPVGYHSAIMRAEDFEDLHLRTQPSDLTYRMLRALGANPAMSTSYAMNRDGVPFEGAESTWSPWGGNPQPFPRGSRITGNVVFFPKFHVFIANPDSFAGLDEDDQEALRRGARAARETWNEAHRIPEDEAARDWCLAGNQVATATTEDLATIRSALSPLVAEMEGDPVVGPHLQVVREIAAETAVPFELPPECVPPTGDGARLGD